MVPHCARTTQLDTWAACGSHVSPRQALTVECLKNWRTQETQEIRKGLDSQVPAILLLLLPGQETRSRSVPQLTVKELPEHFKASPVPPGAFRMCPHMYFSMKLALTAYPLWVSPQGRLPPRAEQHLWVDLKNQGSVKYRGSRKTSIEGRHKPGKDREDVCVVSAASMVLIHHFSLWLRKGVGSQSKASPVDRWRFVSLPFKNSLGDSADYFLGGGGVRARARACACMHTQPHLHLCSLICKVEKSMPDSWTHHHIS